MYQCLNCKKEFNDQTAYCEDWRDSRKSLGCPDCKTFYRPVKDRRWIRESAACTAVVFSAFGAVEAAFSSEYKMAIYFLVILMLISVGWWFRSPISKFTPIQRV